MLPLSCARAHTDHEMSAQKETWSAYKCSLQNAFCTCFIHFIPNSDEFRQNVAQKKFYVHRS